MIVKELLAHPGNYGSSRDVSKIRYIVVHYTGNDGDRAANNARYFRDHVVQASAHYFVDDDSVWLSVPEDRVAWSVGGKKYANAGKTGGGKMYGKITNTNSISVEMCDTIRNGVYQASEKTIKNTVDLVRLLMEKYNIPVENVFRHFDVTGKHCPSYFVSERKWAEFKKRLVNPVDNTPAPGHETGVEWAKKNGILSGNADGDLMLSQPVTRQQFCTMLLRYHKKFGGE